MKLLIEDDEGHRTVVPVIHEEITIGRREGHTVRLTERNVSRDHARIVREDDQVYIEDIDARYGVELNGSRIDGRMPFNEGDVVHIGDYRLTLRPEDVQATESSVTKPQPKVGPDEDDPDDPEVASLTVISRHQPGETFELDAEALVIGRHEECDIVLNHRSVSGRHARVVREGEDYRIIDLDSSNGVKVDGERYRSMPLEPGDIIELGHVTLRFVGPGESWQFGDGETLDEPSTPAAKRRSSETPEAEEDSKDRGILILGAFGIVLVAVVAVVAIRLHDPEPPAPSAKASAADTGVVAAAPSQEDAAATPSPPPSAELAAAPEPPEESDPPSPNSDPGRDTDPEPAVESTDPDREPAPEPEVESNGPEPEPEPTAQPAEEEPAEEEPAEKAPSEKEAEEELEEPERADAGSGGPAPEKLFERATRKWVQGDPRGAIEDCTRALERGYPPCYRVIGMAQKQMGNTREACQHFREYVSTEPDDARKIRRQMDELGCQ
jgi:pSer/pThr/pTyr-binding forkhead associated (FHA) protein